ncbi:MAG TPA: hypothetical protein VI461_06315, partial [Chitinophagaceae bacterium]|nr:hypothetical protein [Chitinophagaceae bacterium]
MSEDHNDYKIPLGELLTILKANGYGISIERILEIQSVLLSTPVFKLSLSELKFIITPVLARNDDDQKNIYKIIDAYIAQKVQRQEKTSHRSSLHIHRRTIFVLKVTGFFLIMATAVLLYTFQKKESAQKPIANYPKQFLPIDSSIANTNADRSTDTPTSKLKLADDIRQIMSNVAYSGKPIIPVRFNIILQVAAAFGLGLGAILYYFIFFERRKRMEAKKKAKEEEESFAAKKDNKTATAEEQLVHAVLQFPAKDFLIQKTKEFLTIRANLKKAALTGKANLAIKESVYATTKNAGFPSLAFDTRLKERKYLLLADKKEPGSHINHLFDFFINFLGSSKIHVVKFTYTSDIRMLNNRSGEIISLEDLSYDYPDYHLVIIGDCKLLLENDNPASQKDIDALFQRWTSKSIITPVPLHDWSDREDQFQKSSFNIVPGEIGAIELLTKAIAEDTQIKSEILENRLKNKYSVSKYAVKTANEVREYLNNEELFQVVCALAVYPKLNWNITLALFAAILRRNPGYTIKPDYDTLLKICRIP